MNRIYSDTGIEVGVIEERVHDEVVRGESEWHV